MGRLGAEGPFQDDIKAKSETARRFFCCTLMMNSPSGNYDTQELSFGPGEGLGIREHDKILQKLNGRAWIDSNRIAVLERQVNALRMQLYVFATLTLLLAVTITMVLVRVTWHPQP